MAIESLHPPALPACLVDVLVRSRVSVFALCCRLLWRGNLPKSAPKDILQHNTTTHKTTYKNFKTRARLLAASCCCRLGTMKRSDLSTPLPHFVPRRVTPPALTRALTPCFLRPLRHDRLHPEKQMASIFRLASLTQIKCWLSSFGVSVSHPKLGSSRGSKNTSHSNLRLAGAS